MVTVMSFKRFTKQFFPAIRSLTTKEVNKKPIDTPRRAMLYVPGLLTRIILNVECRSFLLDKYNFECRMLKLSFVCPCFNFICMKNDDDIEMERKIVGS